MKRNPLLTHLLCGKKPKKALRVMKISFIIMFACVCQLFAVNSEAQNAMIKLSSKTLSVGELFAEIEKQTDYLVVFSNSEVDTNHKLTLTKTTTKVSDCLDEVLSEGNLKYEFTNKYIILSNNTSTQLLQQNDKKVSGVITDGLGEPIIGANIVEKGTTNGTVTDIEGRFMLNTAEKKVLRITYTGYISQEITITNNSVYTIKLIEDTQALEEVVVVGYGTMRKTDLTGSISNINQDNIKNMPTASIDQKLVGQISGVQIMQVSGAPGAGTSVKIRGNGSIGAGNEPLYVVDGMPYSSELNQNLNPLSYINPNDIESITILKDASSTAIYGSRGANGVIMITTKRGDFDKMEVTVSSMFGMQTVPQKGRPNMMNQRDFAEYQREKIAMKVQSVEKRPATDADYPSEYLPANLHGNGTDWYDLLLRTALTQDHSVSVNKGNKDSRLNVSLGYYNQEGVLKYTDMERFSGKISLESNLSKTVKIGASLQPTFINQNRTNTNSNRDDIIGVACWANPVMAPYDINGDLIPYIESPKSKYHSAWSFANPLYSLQETTRKENVFQNLGIAFIEWEIIKGLKVKSSLNTNYTSSKNFQYIPSTVGGSNKPPTKGTGRSSTSRGSGLNWLIENTLTYEKTFNKKHRLNAMVGYTTQKSTYDDINLNADPYPNDLIHTINAAQAIKSWNQSIQDWSMISYLGRANYTYADKYMLTTTFRSDGSSRFGRNARYATFPSVAVAWRASEEKFIKNLSSKISNLKVRLSYGKSGNNNIGNYAHYANVVAGSYIFNTDQVTASAYTIGNPDLTWEESGQIDFGIDLGLFDERLSFVIDYYNRKSTNMLLSDVIPAITGFNSQIVNKGNVRNAGVEFSVNATPIETEFRWDINLNIAVNRNKVLSLNDNGDRILSGDNDANPTHVTVVGKPIGQFFGYVFDGLYTKEDLTNPSIAKYPQMYEGAVRYQDVNGDGQISDLLDYTIIGNPHPDFIYGITNSFSYKDFDLTMVLNGQVGGQVVNGLRQSIDNLQGFFNVGSEWVDRWRSADNPGDGRHYGVPSMAPSLGHRMSDLWLENASYLRISNLTFGYTMPQSVMKKVGFIKACRFYTTMQNLATFTAYKGANPEGQSANQSNVLAPGFDISSYPLARTMSLGLNLTF